MKICYIEKRFRPASLKMIKTANEILEEYDSQGFVLTLRQLFYQFVSRDLIENTQKSYKRIGSLINDARLAGLIDWTLLEDRTRNLHRLQHFNDAGDALDKLASWFHIDFWAAEYQAWRPEVWIEKDALFGVFEGVCNEFDLPLFSCRGYTSQSEMWGAAQRLLRYIEDGQTPIIYHFGDHDPSGIDMSRDIKDRLDLFTADDIQFERVALAMAQIEEYEPQKDIRKISDRHTLGDRPEKDIRQAYVGRPSGARLRFAAVRKERREVDQEERRALGSKEETVRTRNQRPQARRRREKERTRSVKRLPAREGASRQS